METPLLSAIDNPVKSKKVTIDIKVKNCIYNENGRPVKLITVKNMDIWLDID